MEGSSVNMRGRYVRVERHEGVCPNCGAGFKAKTQRRKFCSQKCSFDYWYKTGGASRRSKKREIGRILDQHADRGREE